MWVCGAVVVEVAMVGRRQWAWWWLGGAGFVWLFLMGLWLVFGWFVAGYLLGLWWVWCHDGCYVVVTGLLYGGGVVERMVAV